ncbi:hypothetical protein C8D82_12543 [Victivallis vadensis]|uniref:Uncharacterized protein n=1 Tax=Victivallis vadensis TaxID=172901 RepID=A0A2U1AQG2_9BACT|nr:hypothetical protein C8D82_12543 [Victivallis vadensis]
MRSFIPRTSGKETLIICSKVSRTLFSTPDYSAMTLKLFILTLLKKNRTVLMGGHM